MSCLINSPEARRISKIIISFPESRIPNLVDDVINFLLSKTKTISDLQNKKNLETIVKSINEGLLKLQKEPIEKVVLEDLVLEGLKARDPGNVELTIEDTADLSLVFEEDHSMELGYHTMIKEPSFPLTKYQMHSTSGEIIKTYFPRTPWLYNDMDSEFKRLSYRYLGYNPETGRLHEETTKSLQGGVKALQGAIQFKMDRYKTQITELDKLGLNAADAILNDALGDYQKAYVYKIMDGLIPHLVTKNFGDTIKYDKTEGGFYYKIDSKARTDSMFDGVEDGATTFTGNMHLSTTPLMIKVGPGKYKAKDKFMSLTRLKNTLGTYPSLNQVDNVTGALAESIQNTDPFGVSPELQAVYNKFFNPEPIDIEQPDGTVIKYHSLTWVKENGTPSQSLRAEEIITNFESNVFNLKKVSWASVKDNRLELINYTPPVAGELGSTVNSRLAEAQSNGELQNVQLSSDNLLTITNKDKQVQYQLHFKDSTGRSFNADSPIQASLHKGDPKVALEFFGFNLGDKAQRFIDIHTNQNKDRTDKEPLSSLLGGMGYIYNLNKLGEKAGIGTLSKDTKLLEGNIRIKTRQQKEAGNPVLFPVTAYLQRGTREAGRTYQEVFDLDVADKILNSEGEMIPTYGSQNLISNINSKFKRDENGNAKSPLWEGNAFVEGNDKLGYLGTVYREAIYDGNNPEGVHHSDMTTLQEANFSIIAGFANTVLENPREAFIDFQAGSDKSMQPLAHIEDRTGMGFLPVVDGKLDTGHFFNMYKDTVSAYWQKMEQTILRQYKDEWGIHAGSLKSLDMELKTSGVIHQGAALKNLPSNLYLIEGEGGRAAIRPDLVAYIEIHKDEELLKSYLTRKRRLFAATLSSYKDAKVSPDPGTKGAVLDFKFPEEINKKVTAKFGEKWSTGKAATDGEINPLIDAYFFTRNIAAHNILQVLQGNLFQYKPPKDFGKIFTKESEIDFVALDKALTFSITDMVKRASMYISTSYRPVLAKNASERTRKLDRHSNILYVKDIEVEGDLLAEGRGTQQESQDGAFYIHPVELLRTQHSYGYRKSPLRSQTIKDLTIFHDYKLGTLGFEKKASHGMPLEVIKESKGADIDLFKLNEIMLKGHGFESPVHMKYTALNGTEIDGVFGNYHEVFSALNGEQNKRVFEDIVELMYLYPETRRSVIGKIGFTTSVKAGAHNVNESLQDIIEGRAGPVFTTVSNEHTGIQLNPKHSVGGEHIKGGLSPITQIINAMAEGGASTEESDNLFQSLAVLSEYMVNREFKDHSPRTYKGYVLNLLREYAKKDSGNAALIRRKLSTNDINLADPRVQRIAMSQLMSRMEQLAIKPKFTGGQFVTRSVAGAFMVYDIDGMVMTRAGAESYLRRVKSNLSIDELTPRNLHWVRYVNKETGDGVQGSVVYQALSILQSEKVTLDMYNQWKEQFPDILPEANSIKDALGKVRIEYRKMMDSGLYEMLPGEVLLPQIYKDVYNIEEGVPIDEIINTPDYFNASFPENWQEVHSSFIRSVKGIDVRIPGSGKQSGHPFKVVGFMEGLDNVIGIPVESMLVKGEDLDIDKGNVQLHSVIMHGSRKGGTYPFFTEEGKNISKGGKAKMLRKPEVKEKYPDEYFSLQKEYRGRDDWFEQGAFNYMTDVMASILGDPRNMIEANTRVSTKPLSALNKGVDEDAYFSDNDPAMTFFMNTLNKVGKKMVGVEATAFKAYLAVFHSTQKKINQEKIRLRSDKTSGLPTAFNISFSAGSRLGGPYFDVANTKPFAYSLLGALPIEQKAEAREIIEQAYLDSENKQEAWEVYSQLVNAATDNAKDPILGKLGINLKTGNYVSAGIAIGIPIERIVGKRGLFSDPKVKEVITHVQEHNLSSLDKGVRELYQGVPEWMLPDPLKDLLQLGKYGKEFSFLGKLLKINGELPNNNYELFKLEATVNQFFKKKNFAFDFITWLKAEEDIQLETINRFESFRRANKMFLNPLEVIYNNKHYLQYFKSLVPVMEIHRNVFPQAKIVMGIAQKVQEINSLVVDYEAEQERFEGHRVTEVAYRKIEKLHGANVAHRFFQKYMPSIRTSVGTFDLLTDLGRGKFVRSFSKIASVLESRYPSNAFIKSFRKGKFIDVITGEPIPYIKPTDPKTQRGQDRDIIEQDLKNIGKRDLETVYVYSLLMSNNLAGTPSFEDMFSSDVLPLAAKYARVQQETIFNEKELSQIASDSIALVDEFYEMSPSLEEGERSGKAQFKVRGTGTKRTIYYKASYNSDDGTLGGMAQYTKRYENTVVGLSVSKSAIQEMVDEEGIGISYEPESFYHPKIADPVSSKLSSIIGKVQKDIKSGKRVISVSVMSGYESKVISSVLSKYDADYKVVSASEALGPGHKKVIVTRADMLTEDELEKIERDNEGVILLKSKGEHGNEKKVNVDALGGIVQRVKENIEKKDPLTRIPSNKQYTSLNYSNQDNLSQQYIDMPDAIILSETPGKYNAEVRSMLFGDNVGENIRKGEKLIDRKGVQYTVVNVRAASSSINLPVGGSIVLEGRKLKLVSKNGMKVEIFVPFSDSIVDNSEGLSKTQLFSFVEDKLGMDFVPGRQYWELGKDIDFAYSIRPNDNKYLFENVFLDEGSLYEHYKGHKERNEVLLKVIQGTKRNLQVYSRRYFNVDTGINKPKKITKREFRTLVPVVVDREHDGKVANGKSMEAFAHMLNERGLGFELRVVTDKDIRENMSLITGFAGKKGFTIGGTVYVNSDHATADTPIHEYSHLWLKLLKASDNKLYNDIVSAMLSHPRVKEIKGDYPELEDKKMLGEEVFAHLIGEYNKDNPDLGLLGDMHAYMNHVSDVLATIDEGLTSDMSFSKLAHELTVLQKDGFMAEKLDGFDKVMLEELHGNGNISHRLKKVRNKLIKEGRLKIKCD